MSDDRGRHGGGIRAVLRGNVLVLAAVSLLNDAASEMIYPLLPLFLVGTLGAGPELLGLIEGIAESTASLVKLAGGWLSDRLGRRRALVVIGYAVAAVSRPVIAIASAPWQVLGVRFADRVGKGVRTAPRDALLAESIEPARRGTAFGVHRAADHLGAVVGPLLASGLLLLFPGRLRLVFGLAVIPGIAAAAVALAAVREIAPKTSAAARAAPWFRGLGTTFLRFLAVVFVFTLGNASDAFLLLRASDLGVATALLPLLWVALHASKAGWNVVGGTLADRARSGSLVIMAGWLVYAVVYAGFAYATRPWHAWALFVAYGLFYGLTEAPEKALVARMAPASVRARAFGAYHFAIGLGALPASLLFGLVWQRLGSPAAFLMGATLALVAAVLLPLATRAVPDGGTA